MDTAKIVPRLEKIYPEPSLLLDSPTNDEAGKLVDEILPVLVPGLFPDILELLQEPSRSWFAKDRESRIGMPLDVVTQKVGGEVGWQKADPLLRRLKDLLGLNKRDSGPFILGSKLSFGDLIIVALFEGLRKVASGEHDRLMKYDTSFQELYEASKPWTERDD